MFGPRSIAAFSLKLTLVYVLLVAPWPGLIEGYGWFYGSAVRGLYGSSGPERTVEVRRFRPDQPLTATVMDTEIVVSTGVNAAPDGTRPALQIVRSSRDTAYLPTALVLALVAATPMPRSRKWGALFWGLLIVSWYVVLAPGLMIHDWFLQEEARLGVGESPALWRGLVHGGSQISQWMGPTSAFPSWSGCS
jgi:hypothetical protein